MTIQEFIEKTDLKFSCKRINSRPDGLMDDRNDGMRHFKTTIRNDRNSMVVYFSQGSAHTVDPTLADVLDCIASDISCIGLDYSVNGNDFEQWARDYGYDTDSISALKVYKSILKQSKGLARILDSADYDTLLNDVERL